MMLFLLIIPLLIFVAIATVVFLAFWIVTRLKIFVKILAWIWLVIVGVPLLLAAVDWLISPKNLKMRNYHGHYIVDRSYFRGRQADWQYNSFRFEIKSNDSVYFHVTDRERVVKTYRGVARATSHTSAHLVLAMEEPTHHILSDNPTTYRSAWSFHLVFDSPRFHNVYFKKGKWKAID